MLNVLYIEDNPDDAFFIQTLASDIQEFKSVETKSTLKGGLELMQENQFDCVFLDLSLPDSHGLETIDSVKSDQPQVPIVVFTGLNDQDIALQAINKGAQDYLVKGEITGKLLKKSVFYAIERHKNEHELQLAQKNLAKAEDLAKMGNWEYILKDDSFRVSNGMDRILELEYADQIIHIEDYIAFVLPSDKLRIKNILKQISLDKAPVNYTERVKTPQGKIKFLDTSIECRLNDSEEVLSVFGATIDVTESKKSEIRLKESEDKLLEAQELANIGNWEYNFDSEVFSGSPQAYRIFDIDDHMKNKALGVINEMTWGSDSIRIYKTIKEHIESKEPFSIEFKIGTRKGKVKHIKATAKIFNNEFGPGKKMRGTVQDITVLKEAEEVKEQFTRRLEAEVKERTSELMVTKAKLEQSLVKEKELGELKSRFVSTASHQFRTPLTVIQSSIGLLDMHLEDAPEKMSALISRTSERIKSEVERMTSIMNDVLILGKIEASSVKTSINEMNPADIIKAVIQSYNEIQDDFRKAKLIKSGKSRPIKLDPNLFEHVISNLLSNAFKYSPDRKAPKIILDFKTDAVQIDVVDFGLGIPQEEINSVFEPFFRASNVTQISGTGLGTAIIREYVELMDGTISLESEENKGSVFRIQFNQ